MPHHLISPRYLIGVGALLLLAACSAPPSPQGGSPFYLAPPHEPAAPTASLDGVRHGGQPGGGPATRDRQPDSDTNDTPLSPGMTPYGGSAVIGAGAGQ